MDPQLTTMIRASMPFAEVLGIDVESAEASAARATVVWAAERCTVGGMLHGGYLMAVADSVGGLFASLHVPAGGTTATIESKTNFLRPCTAGTLTVTATPVHIGRSTIVVQTDIADGDERLVSRTIQTQTISPPTPP